LEVETNFSFAIYQINITFTKTNTMSDNYFHENSATIGYIYTALAIGIVAYLIFV